MSKEKITVRAISDGLLLTQRTFSTGHPNTAGAYFDSTVATYRREGVTSETTVQYINDGTGIEFETAILPD